MDVYGLHHVQLAMPRGEEEQARAFYAGVLGMTEVTKPPRLAVRGGVWFRGGDAQLHLGVEDDFRPAKKAHPALVVRGLAELAARCEAHGHSVTPDEPLDGYEHVYVADPFGNRLELIEHVI